MPMAPYFKHLGAQLLLEILHFPIPNKHGNQRKKCYFARVEQTPRYRNGPLFVRSLEGDYTFRGTFNETRGSLEIGIRFGTFGT